nr:HAMP domain-containing sensor histidine kinase [uncultured Agathobacter sp.]
MIWKILTAVLAIIVIIMAAVLLKIRAQLRDINDQLDFLYENDTNMLIGTDTNLIYLGQFKQRVNRFVEQWHKKRAEAAKKEQMISDTYTNLSHDIRTPLTSLDGYFQLLKDEKDEKLQAHYIGIIQERITSLKDMLEELFMFTKLKNDTFKLEMDKCCVSRLLKQTVFSYYDEWKMRGIEPVVDICDEQIFILANTQALKRVFQNVIKNGLVHGKSDIEIKLYTIDSGKNAGSDRENKVVNIVVSNTIDDPENIDTSQVFERFYKADEARSVTSSGLGLSIAKELVERMGGKINAQIEDNRFCINISYKVI